MIVGIAHLFADGISMGLGDAMSSQAERDYNYAERQRERWEMEVCSIGLAIVLLYVLNLNLYPTIIFIGICSPTYLFPFVYV